MDTDDYIIGETRVTTNRKDAWTCNVLWWWWLKGKNSIVRLFTYPALTSQKSHFIMSCRHICHRHQLKLPNSPSIPKASQCGPTNDVTGSGKAGDRAVSLPSLSPRHSFPATLRCPTSSSSRA
ncbi:hypothetical protein BJ165DRAFT_579123 [Panaeolus papilionaceus]|nr:hypothetical protein BJ165DRAFT_579123 [Panaeolus papilionaceus]